MPLVCISDTIFALVSVAIFLGVPLFILGSPAYVIFHL